jgi:mRNA interferase HigB
MSVASSNTAWHGKGGAKASISGGPLPEVGAVERVIPKWGHNWIMRVVALKTLRRFWAKYPAAEQPLLAWHDEVQKADWRQPADIKARFGSASILKNRRVVFNIKGNDYRLVAALAYNTGLVFVKFIGTHKAYDAIDAETVQPE